MKRIKTLLMIGLIALSLSACSSGVSQSEYDTLKKELEEINKEKQELQKQISNDSIKLDSSFVVDKEMEISFAFGKRTGMYTGTVNDKGLPNGYGKFTNTTPDIGGWSYFGEWQNGSFNGYGITRWDSTQIHLGEYKFDNMHGIGMYLFPDNTVFCGEFENGQAVASFIIEQEENAPTPTKEPIINTSDKYETGTYKVGKTIPAGAYCLINEQKSSNAEIQINIDSSNQFSSIGLMLETNTFAYFSVNDGEYLEIDSGYVIPLENYTPATVDVTNEIPSGMYIIGKDIPLGEYEIIRTHEKSRAYFEIYTEIPSSKDKIFVTLDYIEKNGFITLEEGQVILFRNGYMTFVE